MTKNEDRERKVSIIVMDDILRLSILLNVIDKESFYVNIRFCQFDEQRRSIALNHIIRALKIEIEGTLVWQNRIKYPA